MADDDDARRRRVVVWVNGLFNPKRDDDWAERKTTLEDIFGCPAHHVHNPTLAVALPGRERALELAKRNAGFALGASFLAVAAVAVDTYLDAGLTEAAIATTMDGVKSKLDEQALEVAAKMETEVSRLCAAARGVREVVLVSHSHGGWCTAAFMQSEALRRVAEEFGVVFSVFSMGCPVLLPAGGVGVARVLQLHNERDVISLRYADDEAPGAATVVRSDAESYHSASKYIVWLREVLADEAGQAKQAQKRAEEDDVD